MNRTKIHLLPATLCLCAAWLVCTTTACTDRIETDTVLPGGGETIEVSVRLGFAPEENAANAATDTRTYTGKDKGQAFSAQLQAEANTRETTTEITTPDKLYGLNYFLYDQAGTTLLGSGYLQNAAIGSALNLTLSESATQYDDCQLVIIARGTAANSQISTVASSTTDNASTLSALQAISFDRDVIDAIPTSGATKDEMNKMPYVLHLKHVRLVKENNAWKLQSPEVDTTGAQDVRLMLKRLAAKVTVNWDYGVKVNNEQYTLKQLLLQEVPLKFNYIPAPNKDDGSYPDVMDQYTTLTVKDDYSVSGNQTNGSYSFWVPANVRADNPAVSSALLRTKDNAPAGSSYLTFEAQNNVEAKKKFRYRIYIGDDNPQNFSIRQNTDYIYNIDFKHTGIPVQDRRVTYVDPIPASQNNNNFVPTANCFMVKPGGSFCFDPFLFRSGGKDIENNVLAGWITAGTATRTTTGYGIQYVKLLWQTKEEGDLGEPVMGIVNSDDDHSNIVDIKDIRGDSPQPVSTPFTAANQCRIYCRVAPGTTGGNGVIAAYDTEGKILWSWHIWVTDYNPDCTGSEGVLNDPNKRKLKFSYNKAATNQLPMMDRNLGAMAGFVDRPTTQIQKSKTNGLHYQWGRKDPFPSSYTNNPNIVDIILPKVVTKPIEGLLNLYDADGVTYLPLSLVDAQTTYRAAYQNPQSMYKNSGGNSDTDSPWLSTKPSDYNLAWGTTKTVHDPSPAGWRVAQISDYLSLCTRQDLTVGSSDLKALELKLKNSESYKADGGMLLGYDGNDNHATFVRFTGYYRKAAGVGEPDKFAFIGKRCLMWTGSHSNKSNSGANIRYFNVSVPASGNLTADITLTGHEREAIPLRCIQESAE